MRILFFLFLTINLMGQTPPRVTFKQIQKDTLTGSIAVSGLDSNLTYSRNFYISADSFLILYGDTVGQGSLNAILVDGVTILGDGVNTNLSADTNLIKDIIGGIINAGLGIDVSYNPIDKEILIESMSIEDTVYNGTGTQINKGTPLYVVGVQGNYWSVAPADAGDISKLPVVAIAGENIADGTEGLALIKGHIKGVNTSAFTAGDEVYVAVGGGYTNVKPKGESNYVQYLGSVIKTDANGSGIINLGEVESNLNPGRIFIGGADSTITRVTLNDSISAIVGDSLNSNVVRSITAGTFLSGGTITTSGTIALDTASAGLKTYISDNKGTVNLASGVTGTLPVANGGTGATTLTSGAFLKGNGTSAVSGSSNLTETADTVYVAKFLNVDTSTLYVDAVNNRVGIGTSSPAYKLDVNGDFNINAANTDDIMFIRGTFVGTNTAADTGIIRIGGGEPNQIRGFLEMRQVFDGTFTDTDFGIIATDGGVAVTEVLTVKGTGNMGVGTQTPAYKLDVNGNVRGDIFYSDNNSFVQTPSDIRLKKNISSYNYITDKLTLLNIVNWEWNDVRAELLEGRNSKDKIMRKTESGLIAQEVESLFPDLVSVDNTGYKTLSYIGFIVPLLKGFQEQQLIIETQQQEIETLKTQYNDLLQRIINLENK